MSLVIKADITAVKLHENLILAGIGSYLHVYSKKYDSLLQRIRVLKGQKIYNFEPCLNSPKILVIGGKQFTVISSEQTLLSEGPLQSLQEPVLCDDWLHYGIWINEAKIALLTAHNVVQFWDTTKQCMLSQCISKDNSILYSGLLLPVTQDVVVFAGTVFSEVIIHRCSNEEPLHRLTGHKGVIFSISCDPHKGIIVTTSDDRSVRIWSVNNHLNYTHNSIDYWENTEIVCRHELYGHTARVMRSCIANNLVISVGEDSNICFWDYHGKLLRTHVSHQNSAIWSVNADCEHLVTGGADGAVALHPLTLVTDYGKNEVINNINAKKLVFTARKNIVILAESDCINYYDTVLKCSTVINLNHESTYKLLSISLCKQIIAVADMSGNLDMFAENCKDEAYLYKIINTKLQIGKILSMQWAGNRHLVFCSENGFITILASKGNNVEQLANFILPPCKERWLTASAINASNDLLVLGDRCGNIHFYVKDKKNPIKSFRGKYGPTSITINGNYIIATGRESIIKMFTINKDMTEVKHMTSKELDFPWIEKFIDKELSLVCGFQERFFIVYNMKTNQKILEVLCGGGHRSWDVIRYFSKINENLEEMITFVYIKNADINLTTYQLNKISTRNLENCTHSKEINNMKVYKPDLCEPRTLILSGGEDTTLRVSSLNSKLQFKDELTFKQLSSIRTLKILEIEENTILLVSGGGRALISIKILKFSSVNNEFKIESQDITDYMIKGPDKKRKCNKTWRHNTIDFDPETRIMDLEILRVSNYKFLIIAGCSDAYVRTFELVNIFTDMKFELINEIKFHKTCILKMLVITFLDSHILITCSTRGEISLWNLSNTGILGSTPFLTENTNKSGINSISARILPNNQILVATGGDDNSIHLIAIDMSDQNNLDNTKVSHTWSCDNLHSSQITGLILLDDVMISTSIDQRITLCEWRVTSEGITCGFHSQTWSDIADIQGMDLIDNTSSAATVCVFGKGFEIITLAKPKSG